MRCNNPLQQRVELMHNIAVVKDVMTVVIAVKSATFSEYLCSVYLYIAVVEDVMSLTITMKSATFREYLC